MDKISSMLHPLSAENREAFREGYRSGMLDPDANKAELQRVQGLLDEAAKRLENALWFQQKAKTFINHFEDCDAVTEDIEEGFCECGLEEFASDNELSRKISKELLQKLKGGE